MAPPTYFPLRWESTRDQWWYASPIDWAAANGHYDLVRELLRIDNNHLFKLTSLRRIKRLETVWDDEAQFHDVAKFRSQVAQKLLDECECNKGKNSLIGAGYGGWLMYTAASAGDLGFVKELLERDPLLVFREGEYGVTDIFYAAARSKSCEVFRVLFDFAVSPRFRKAGESEEGEVEFPPLYRREMMNRAIHAAARGGNLVILKEILEDCDEVLSYRDVIGSTVLHAAAGKGQVEVVKYLTESYNMMDSTDNNGNTPLHLAAHKGQLATVRALISASPSSATIKNNTGETFFHMAISGFHSPSFRRLDRQMELVKELITSGQKLFSIEEIINARNNEGRTPLHLAITGNLHSELVELLMTIRSIDVNVRDSTGLTPLNLLKQRPRSASSDILIRQLISAGGMFGIESKDFSARKAIATQIKMQGCGGSSPGTNFGISDSEILLYTGVENPQLSDRNDHGTSFDSTNDNMTNKRPTSVIGKVLHWPRRKDRSLKKSGISIGEEMPTPVPLRQRFSNNNKRALSVRSNTSSPTNRKKLATGLRHGIIETMPHINLHRRRTPSSSFSRSSVSSTPTSFDKQKGLTFFDPDFAGPSCSGNVMVRDNGGDDIDTPRIDPKRVSIGKRLRAQYFCFGGPSLAVKKPVSRNHANPTTYKCPVPSVA